ncbi:MAG: glycosyltransferase family 39 protein [Candidatus Omnitrophota bacterium]|nr:glycosyltransferase family 39 protein [Candidatus Omnitrophota bacterium]
MMQIFIVLTAFFLRAFNIGLFPINHDEASWTIPGINNFDTFCGFPVSCFHGYIQPIYSDLVFVSKNIFAAPELLVRMPAIIIGTCTVSLMYLLAREAYGRKTGLIAAALLCFLPWHILQSRIGVSLILTPLFGCLIATALLKSAHTQRGVWFYLFCCLLSIGSFYTYQASLVFLPVFGAAIVIIKKDLKWLRPKQVFLGCLGFLVMLYPLAHLYFNGKIPQYFGKVYRMYDGSFMGQGGNLLMKSFVNLKLNLVPAFKGIFFANPFILYGQAMKNPLLAHWITLPLFAIGIALACVRKRSADKLFLAWAVLGYLCALSGVRFFADRYFFTIILPPCLVLIALPLAYLFEKRLDFVGLRRLGFFLCGTAFFCSLVFLEITQWGKYYYTAPIDFEECRFNSYGCQQAALYLNSIPEVEECIIREATNMEPLGIYRSYYRYGNVYSAGKWNPSGEAKASFFLHWAEETHPNNYRGGMFSRPREQFMKKYPYAKPLRIIYYPDGQPAIKIYKIETNTES